ncbi:MAG: hypothetical protein IKJ68_08910 [Clostridia bacterium]|nr:hypothetical protein [Clostridia bacterium]
MWLFKRRAKNKLAENTVVCPECGKTVPTKNILSFSNFKCCDDCINYFGTCGEDAYWRISRKRTLHIYGSGVVTEFENINDHGRRTTNDPHNLSPFYSAPTFFEIVQNNNIRKIIIEDGINSVGEGVHGDVFWGLSNLREVVIAKSVVSIHKETFRFSKEANNVDLIIYGDQGSCAETFAKENGYRFERKNMGCLDFMEIITPLDKFVKIFGNDSERTGESYFCYEAQVKDGVERSKKVISCFASKNYEFKEISLCGGIDELSHTGYLSYYAEYADAQSFSDKAYSDYVTSLEKAEAFYGSWLSCYNFSSFFVWFEGNNNYILASVDPEETMKIRCSSKDIESINEVVSMIKKEIYHNQCIVEIIDV